MRQTFCLAYLEHPHASQSATDNPTDAEAPASRPTVSPDLDSTFAAAITDNELFPPVRKLLFKKHTMSSVTFKHTVLTELKPSFPLLNRNASCPDLMQLGIGVQ